jgi:hypothetical protein
MIRVQPLPFGVNFSAFARTKTAKTTYNSSVPTAPNGRSQCARAAIRVQLKEIFQVCLKTAASGDTGVSTNVRERKQRRKKLHSEKEIAQS